LAELLAAWSLAVDLGLGQPLGHSLSACLLAMRLGELLALSDDELKKVYLLALLRYTGCTSEAHRVAEVFGDDIEANSWIVAVDQTAPAALLAGLLRRTGQRQSAGRRIMLIGRAVLGAPRLAKDVTAAHCEVAQIMVGRLGFGSDLQALLAQTFERWDGKGPGGMKADAIVRPVRVVQLALDAQLYHRIGGVSAAVEVARRRSGGAHDPAIVAAFCDRAEALLSPPAAVSTWEEVLAAEPHPQINIAGEDLDSGLSAIADFADLKSPCLRGHSRGVARLATEAAERTRLPSADVAVLRGAALLHDLGRVGVPNSVWDKPARLADDEWEQVRLHPYYSERILSRSEHLAPLGTLAGLHHERLDGSGYHRALPSPMLQTTARILAAADVYQALIETRPHRPAFTGEAAASELRREVAAGRLDGDATVAVLEVAGAPRPVRPTRVGGLTDREVEVLRLIARGHSDREVARRLDLSQRTAHHHVEHIYDKIDVTTRAGAALFAMQHNLLED
jgi:HD-GYP domain-containing protein (c-di-GMP phosphodiesterase class II)/DNA-binding CsgD family transcriptional regulator